MTPGSRLPLILSWLFTGAAVLFATGYGLKCLLFSGPWSPYDPNLAVLTVTLTALIWSTYFTYRLAVHAQASLEITRTTATEERRRNLQALDGPLRSVAAFVMKLETDGPGSVNPPNPDVMKNLREKGRLLPTIENELVERLANAVADLTKMVNNHKTSDEKWSNKLATAGGYFRILDTLVKKHTNP